MKTSAVPRDAISQYVYNVDLSPEVKKEKKGVFYQIYSPDGIKHNTVIDV